MTFSWRLFFLPTLHPLLLLQLIQIHLLLILCCLWAGLCIPILLTELGKLLKHLVLLIYFCLLALRHVLFENSKLEVPFLQFFAGKSLLYIHQIIKLKFWEHQRLLYINNQMRLMGLFHLKLNHSTFQILLFFPQKVFTHFLGQVFRQWRTRVISKLKINLSVRLLHFNFELPIF